MRQPIEEEPPEPSPLSSVVSLIGGLGSDVDGVVLAVVCLRREFSSYDRRGGLRRSIPVEALCYKHRQSYKADADDDQDRGDRCGGRLDQKADDQANERCSDSKGAGVNDESYLRHVEIAVYRLRL